MKKFPLVHNEIVFVNKVLSGKGKKKLQNSILKLFSIVREFIILQLRLRMNSRERPLYSVSCEYQGYDRNGSVDSSL